MTSSAHKRAWRDWGTVNPLYGILTDPRYRHGGSLQEFFDTGEGTVEAVLEQAEAAGLYVRNGAALDFGCGIGRLTFALAKRFDHVTGVDASPTMLAKAAELHPPVANCELALNDTDDLAALASGSFDLVLCLYVLQHLESVQVIERFLCELVRVARPGGAVVFQLPARVPAHRPPLPPLRTVAGLRTRTASLLRRAGVGPRFLARHLDWVPEMTMLALARERVQAVVESAGGRVVAIGPVEVDPGGTEHLTYFVTC